MRENESITNMQRLNGRPFLAISESTAMNDCELLYLCRRILAVAVQWREAQDEVLRSVHSAAIAVRQLGQVSRTSVIDCLRQDSPGLWNSYSEEYITTSVATLLSTTVRSLSALFSGLYVEFNSRYFAGTLPTLSVRVTYSATHGPHNVPRVYANEIELGYNGWPEEMVALLLESMTLFAVNYDEKRWAREIDRFRFSGVPVRDNLDDRPITKWPWERSSYGPVLEDQFD
jgi:hypothetical protein